MEEVIYRRGVYIITYCPGKKREISNKGKRESYAKRGYLCIGQTCGQGRCNSRGCGGKMYGALKVIITRVDNGCVYQNMRERSGWICLGCFEGATGAKNPLGIVVDYMTPLQKVTPDKIEHIEMPHGQPIPISGGSRELVRKLGDEHLLYMDFYSSLPSPEELNIIIQDNWNDPEEPLLQQRSSGAGRGSPHKTSSIYSSGAFFLDTWTHTKKVLDPLFGFLFNFLGKIEKGMNGCSDMVRGHIMLYTCDDDEDESSAVVDEGQEGEEEGKDEENDIGEEEDEEDDEEVDVDDEVADLIDFLKKYGICRDHGDKDWDGKPEKRCLFTTGSSITEVRGYPKIFRITDNETGRFVDIVCQSGTFLQMSKFLSGCSNPRYTHSVRWAGGTYCLVMDYGFVPGQSH